MDGNRFDELTRGLAHGRSRRGVMKGLGAAVLGAAGLARLGGVEAKTTCRNAGHPCEGNQTCCDGLVCVASGPGAALRCAACPDGTVIDDGACCTPDSHDVTCAGKCGPVVNNCGQTVDCGSPITTCPAGACGSVDDGCGGTLDCGPCCTPAAAACSANADCCSGVCACGDPATNTEIGFCQSTSYHQDFSADAYDWSGVTASGGVGIAATGSSFPAFSRWGGYSSVFPSGGYTTSLDIFLDIAAGYANDTRFDWDSAINHNDCGFGRDFVFNAGFYNDGGLGPRFVISASNNAGRANSYPKNPGRNPITITTSGWYTFTHAFYDNGGALAADLTVAGHTWTLSDPSDLIGGIGGNRYGAFPNQEIPGLQIDNASRS